MRGVDLLASRAEVDPRRIGAFGCSGGGTVTAYLAALDDRIAAAGVACYANTLARLLPAVGSQEAEQSIPDFVSRGLDLPDWFELAAPKPYAIVSTTEDMFPDAGARDAVGEMRDFWGAFGAAVPTNKTDTLELGYWLGEPYWGRGFATEAAEAIVAYAFDELAVPK